MLAFYRNNYVALRKHVAFLLKHVAGMRTIRQKWIDCLAATEEGLALVEQGADVRRVLADICSRHRFKAVVAQKALQEEHLGPEGLLHALKRQQESCMQHVSQCCDIIITAEQDLSALAGILRDERGEELPKALADELNRQLGASCLHLDRLLVVCAFVSLAAALVAGLGECGG